MWQLFYSKEGIIILIITEGTIAQLNWKMEVVELLLLTVDVGDSRPR